MNGELVTRLPLRSGLESFFADPITGSSTAGDPQDTSSSAPLPPPERSWRPLEAVWMQWLVCGLLLLSIAWGAWSAKAILDLQKREIVSVSLTTILRDFVMSESNRSQTPEMATARTRIFLSGVDEIMKGLKEDGKIVLLSEAVAGNTVPDVTAAITEAVRRGFEGAGSAGSGPAALPAPGPESQEPAPSPDPMVQP